MYYMNILIIGDLFIVFQLRYSFFNCQLSDIIKHILNTVYYQNLRKNDKLIFPDNVVALIIVSQ